MAHWPYDANIPHTDSDAVISGGAPSTTLSVSGHAAGDLMLCIVLTPSPNAPTDDGTGTWSVHADVTAQDVDSGASDDNKVSLYSKVAAGDETTVTISGNDTDPQDGLSGMLVVLKGGGFVDDAAWAYGGSSPVTSVGTTITSGNTELIFLLTQIAFGANPTTTDTRCFHVASQSPNNEVEGIDLWARRRGPGATSGVTFTTTVGTIPSTVAVAVSLRYPGRTIRRIDFHR